ncbi:uncharacterized protein LOC8027870 isoform X1 [Ixodes scapularis]|uniref:uncharacterized protein LOC8027870 isoform X1 n=1 Tax=Ixodes scapularis TaxID=6945 RepID=UPI001A9FDDE1|nr:uncharacterized protein LOC8027870 isoform X1 [Ixodes scapularis]
MPVAVGWRERRCPTLGRASRHFPDARSVPASASFGGSSSVSTMDKAQEAAGMGALDYATGDLASTISSRDLLPPPAYKRPGSERLKMSVVLASALVAVSVVVGVVVVLVVHLRGQQQLQCACAQALPAAMAFTGRGGAQPDLSSGLASKMPLKLQLDPLAGQLLKKNQRAQVSCVVEKKKASEVIAHEPKTLITPFGNMTTEPRMVHLTGERMVFSCLTGTRDDSPRNARNGRVKRGIAEEKDCACNCSC